jgi:hypothetical protein
MAVTTYCTINGEIIGEKVGAGARTDYLTDALGNVTATLNQSASVVNTNRYGPYGRLLARGSKGADPTQVRSMSRGICLFLLLLSIAGCGNKTPDVYIASVPSSEATHVNGILRWNGIFTDIESVRGPCSVIVPAADRDRALRLILSDAHMHNYKVVVT